MRVVLQGVPSMRYSRLALGCLTVGCLVLTPPCPAQRLVWKSTNFGVWPSARELAGAAYDSSRQRMVLFGGRSSSGTEGETWEYDGRWTRVYPTNSPPPNHSHAMTYDSARQRIVLFGGPQRWTASRHLGVRRQHVDPDRDRNFATGASEPRDGVRLGSQRGPVFRRLGLGRCLAPSIPGRHLGVRRQRLAAGHAANLAAAARQFRLGLRQVARTCGAVRGIDI